MRIAHWSLWAPNRSGMFHTTKDIVESQRSLGLDCGLIDALKPEPKTDGKFTAEGYQYADTADIYALHLAIPEPYMSDGTPQVIFLHGHPLYSQQVELYGLEPGNDKPFTTICNYFNNTDGKWFVSFWEDDQKAYWDVLDNGRNRVRYIQRGIRFGDEWTPEGKARQLEGDPCIVIADQFRVFKDVLPCLWGAFNYWLENPKTRIYMYGLPPRNSRERECLDRWLTSTGMHSAIAGLEGIVDYLPEVFRRADVVVSNVTCESRVVVEAAACGCKVVAPWESATAYVRKPWRPDSFARGIAEAVDSNATREKIAKAARKDFNSDKTAEQLMELYEEIMRYG